VIVVTYDSTGNRVVHLMCKPNVAPTMRTLTVTTTGTGVVFAGGLACPSACTGSFEDGTVVFLNASPAGGSVFGGWTGACSGTSVGCTITMNADKTVGASFHPPPPPAGGIVDFCNLQFPPSMTMSASALISDPIFGRVFEAGVTEAAGPSPRVFAQLGKGPAGSDPRTSANWTWSPVGYNRQVDNNDEYQSALQANTPGTYAYTYRFSLDGGPYTYCDLDGAGENPGLAFDPAQLGMLTVTP
jgi:uncharacterized repeat protein (TIGR02543 family)